jgi:outer membrane protein
MLPFRMLPLMCMAVLLVSAPSLTAQAADAKIGVVDLQKVLHSTTAGKAAAKKFEDLQKAKKGQLDVKEKDLGKREKDLFVARQEIEKALQEAQGKVSDEMKAKIVALQDKGKKFEQDVMELEKRRRDIVDELAKKEAELLKPIEDSIRTKVEAIAKERGLQLVINRQVAVYASDAVDITAEVIKRCDTP